MSGRFIKFWVGGYLMRFIGVFGTALLLAAAIGGPAGPAAADEVIVYTYDALGRLVGVQRSGATNNGVTSTIQYDNAGNRLFYATAGVQGGVIFRQSFENGLPSLIQKGDGGWTYPAIVSQSPAHGAAAVRMGMVGSHVFALSSPTFVASQPTVTLSFYFRDSGVTNQSLTGWSGSTVDSAAPVLGGVYDLTTSSWSLDGWGNWSEVPVIYPSSGGAWARYVRTFSGLQVGRTYAVTVFVEPYHGSRATDIDAVQIEYGSTVSPF